MSQKDRALPQVVFKLIEQLSMKNNTMPKVLSYEPKYALNAICPYFTMFPLEFPFKILSKHKRDNPVILDPFCGRGTTIYAARELGLSAWGIDTSPIAVAIAKAKLASASKTAIVKLARKLMSANTINIPHAEFFHYAYSSQTLMELCALREGLMNLPRETDASVLLRAIVLGCLHGPLNKHLENASYFSNQMPRTFSTKPDYSIKYWRQKNLLPPKVKVLDVIERKLSRISGLEKKSIAQPRQILCADARANETFQPLPQNISLVITSPPYYGMKTYIQDQWLRQWFLGGPEELCYSNDEQLNHNGQDTFIRDLANVWSNITHRSTADNLHLYIRFGSIPSIKSDSRNILLSSIEEAGGLEILSTRNAKTAFEGKRQAAQMTKNSKPAIEYDFHARRLH